MNNLFLEGPIRAGKSTAIRLVLAEHFSSWSDDPGSSVCHHDGDPINQPIERFTTKGSARRQNEIQNPINRHVGGFTCQRISFPTSGSRKRYGFRLMPACAPISTHSCVVADDDALIASDGVFKIAGRDGSRTDISVFDTTGVSLIKDAMTRAKAGEISLVLLDEIGGHEMICDRFRNTLYEILDSEIPCLGVIKRADSTANMVRRLPAEEAKIILQYNAALHKKITGENNSSGEIIQFVRDDHAVIERIRDFIVKI